MVLLVGKPLNLQCSRRIATSTPTPKSKPNPNTLSTDHVRAPCNEGRLKDALSILYLTDRRVDTSTYVHLLEGCIRKNALSEGKQIHAHISEMGIKGHKFLGNTLINMYVKCGSLEDAGRVFDEMPQRDVCSWTVMIAAYSRHGCPKEALSLYHQMQRTGLKPNQFTFASVLPACGNMATLEMGVEIHEEVIRNGFQSDVVVANVLIYMYAKCGRIGKAREVFDKMHQEDVFSWTTMLAGYAQSGLVDEAVKLFKEMPQRNVVSWNAMIAGFAQNGHCKEALELFCEMQSMGMKPDSKTFVSLLPTCASLEQGMEVHEEIIRSGFQYDVVVMTALVDMYAQCRLINKARELFDRIHHRDLVSWNAMIIGYTQNGLVQDALELFKEMPERNVVSGNALIAGFAQNGHGAEALEFFRQMHSAGYAMHGCGKEALKLFEQMNHCGVNPNRVTLVIVLSAWPCRSSG